ncbi:hypothetical protein [Stenotrophomonas sp. TWI1151]|uniref:hypothetical protein n=1 Tax=Stenotrophomonas sp. TWI1151 TaxID=3136798 RepID=UPI00320AF6F3
MSISVNGIDIPEAIMNLEFEVARTQRILDWLVNNNKDLRPPSQSQLDEIFKESLRHVQKKYPDAGVKPAQEPNQGSNAPKPRRFGI